MGGPDNRRICLAIEGGLEMSEKNRLKAAEVTISEICTDDNSANNSLRRRFEGGYG